MWISHPAWIEMFEDKFSNQFFSQLLQHFQLLFWAKNSWVDNCFSESSFVSYLILLYYLLKVSAIMNYKLILSGLLRFPAYRTPYRKYISAWWQEADEINHLVNIENRLLAKWNRFWKISISEKICFSSPIVLFLAGLCMCVYCACVCMKVFFFPNWYF